MVCIASTGIARLLHVEMISVGWRFADQKQIPPTSAFIIIFTFAQDIFPMVQPYYLDNVGNLQHFADIAGSSG